MASAGTPNPNQSQESTGQIAQEIHWIHRATFWSQVGLGVIGIAALIIYGCQLGVMRGTLAEMKRSGEQSTEQMWGAISNINWMARSADWSQKTAQQGIQASDKESSKALKATQDQMRLDQRAWLAIKDMHGPPSDPVITFTNTGHTPALEIETHISWKWTSDPPQLIDPQEYIRLGIVSPKTERTLNLVKVGPEQTDKPLYTWGVFTYRDIFRACHWVSLCFRLSDDRKQYQFCEQHNDTDKNDETPTKLTHCLLPTR